MRRERIRYEPGAAVSPRLRYQDLEPIAVPPADVARRLGITVEQAWPPKWSRASLPTGAGCDRCTRSPSRWACTSRMERALKGQDRAS
jgi:hypothetical protein